MVSTKGSPAQRHPTLLVPTLVFVGLLVAIVSSLGAPLVPSIAQADHVSLSTAEWVLTAALLTGALATPVMGRLADGPHQRRVILVTLSIVLAGCVLSAVSTTFLVLVIGRALQGLGLGLLPVNMAIARRNLEAPAAGRAIATLSVSNAIGAGLGYPLTATVAEVFNLHAAYWFGALVVTAALVCSLIIVPGRTGGSSQRFDVTGAVLLSLVTTTLSVVLSEGGTWGWHSPITLGLATGGAVVLALWVPHELRSPHPLVNLRHLANRSLLMADVTGFLMSVSMYLVVPIVVEFIQVPASTGFGFDASLIVSGLVLVPLSIGTFVASRLLVPYERRFGVRSLIPLGALIFAAASTYFAFEHGSLCEAFVTMGIVGLGIGFTFAAMPGFIIRSVSAAETGSATGFYQVLRNIGLAVGSALSAAVLLAFTHPGHTYPALGGFRAALVLSAILGVVTAVLSFVLPGSGPKPTLDAARATVLAHQMEDEALLEATGAMLVDDDDLTSDPRVRSSEVARRDAVDPGTKEGTTP